MPYGACRHNVNGPGGHDEVYEELNAQGELTGFVVVLDGNLVGHFPPTDGGLQNAIQEANNTAALPPPPPPGF